MPQDKRLIITRAVLHKVQRVCGSADAASAEGIFIEFVVPAVVVTQCPELTGKYVFQLPNRTYVMNGRTTCLIVPRLLSGGAFKVNKRHGYYDAVVTAEAICKRGDTEAARRAAQVAKTFAHFVVDSRIVSKLPSCITDGAVVTKVATMKVPSTVADEKSDRKNEQGRKGSQKPPDGAIVKGSQQYVETEKAPVGMPPLVKLSRKCITPLHNLDEQGNLTLRLAQGASGSVVRVRQAGQLVVRVGHGGMVPGEVCDNAKSFVYTLKREFPTVWKYIHEFQMTSAVTEPIRFMEVHIQNSLSREHLMQNVILAHDGSVVAPRRYSTTQQQTAQQPSSSTHSTRNQKHHHQQLQQQSDADDNCAYLQRHCIPSKVEGLFSNVLNDLPNDPLLHIVEQLRASNNSNNLSNGGNPPNHSKQATNESIREGATGSGTTEGKEPVPPTTPCAPFTRTALVSEGLNPEPPTRGNNPVSGAEDPFVHSMNVATESGCRPVGENLNTPPASVDAAGLSLANATPTTTPLTTSATPSVTTCESMNAFTLASGRARTPTPPAFSELSCTNYRGSVNGARPATHAMRPSSRGSSRNEVVQGVCGVRFGATNDIFYGGPMPPTLDRDESTRSDLSAFSVASMDLQDFLQEFRSAKVESVGAEAKMVDINAISDIIQNVNIPLPDTPIIADLFDEVRNIAALRYDTEASPDQANDMDCQKRISATTTVVTGSESNLIDCIYFEAFLARMAFMIQGRYPMEVLRGTFYSIGESARQKPSADGAAQPSSVTPPQTTQQQQQQKVCAEDIRGPSTSSFGVASRPYRVAAKSGCRNSNSGALSADSSSNTHTSPTVIPTTAACPINCSAAEQAAEPSALLNGVPLAICVEEGLWRGLGLPATREEVERALHTLGIPVDGNYKCHVNDFVRLVTVLTSGGMSGLSCEKTSPWGPVGIGRESSFLQQPQE